MDTFLSASSLAIYENQLFSIIMANVPWYAPRGSISGPLLFTMYNTKLAGLIFDGNEFLLLTILLHVSANSVEDIQTMLSISVAQHHIWSPVIRAYMLLGTQSQLEMVKDFTHILIRVE